MKKIAAGFLSYPPKSKRILLGLRIDTNTWANFGGGFEAEKDKTVKNTAIRELSEETGCNSDYEISKTPLNIYENNFIRYYTYLNVFKKMFHPNLNNEHKNYGWFKLDNLPSNVMPECLATIKKSLTQLESIKP